MNQAMITLASLASILMAWVGIFWLYRDYTVDSFRQRMFRLRDEMFDDAMVGKLSFDDAAYGMLRITMNGAIRYAHLLTPLQLFLGASRYGSRRANGFAIRFSQALENVDPEKTKHYRSYLKRIHLLLVNQLLFGSPLVVITIVVPIGLGLVVAAAVDRLLSALSGPIDDIDDLAFSAGRKEHAQLPQLT